MLGGMVSVVALAYGGVSVEAAAAAVGGLVTGMSLPQLMGRKDS